MFSFVALCSLRVGTHERKSARCRQSSANEKTSARPALRFQKSRGLSRIASSRPIIHRARATSRATSREIPRAPARVRHKFTRARALQHPSRASPPPRATTRHPSSRRAIGRPRPSVSRINPWMQTRDRDRARSLATRDAHLSTSMLNVFSAIGAMIFGMNRWTRACRSDDARRGRRMDASRARRLLF